MKIGFSSDASEDAFPYKIFNELGDKGFSDFFLEKDLGNNEIEIFMVLICHPAKLKLRKRFDAKDGVLYWDVMLDYKAMKKEKKDGKRKLIAEGIITSFDILDSYKKLHFDKDRLKEEASNFFRAISWLT